MQTPAPTNLSPTYYWDYYQFVLRYVKKHYNDLLNPAEIEFFNQFHLLSKSAQCLYLRLCSRSTSWFLTDKIKYAEIESLGNALQELFDAQFLQAYESDVLQTELLHIISKEECLHMARQLFPGQRILSSVSKGNLVDLLNYQPYGDVITLNRYIRPNYKEYYTLSTFLFFGSRHRDLTEFVVRDLGHRQFVDVAEDELLPYFASRKEIDQKWEISLWREWFWELKDMPESAEIIIQSFDANMLPLLSELTELAIPAFEKMLFQVGRFLERQAQLDAALRIFAYSGSVNSLERRVRILSKLKRHEEAIYWAEFGCEYIENIAEIHFFQDFLAKQVSKKNINKVTSSLKEAELIEIDASWQGNVEQGVVDYFQSHGYYAIFSENRLWKNVLGLLSWDLIFEEKKTGYHHPFQYAPSYYGQLEFASLSQQVFDTRLEMLDSVEQTLRFMREVGESQQGKLNPLVDWYSLDWEFIERALRVIDIVALRAVLTYMWNHLATHSKGFPDLFIEKDGDYFFIEVKSPNDHLSAIQYYWHDFFKQVGIPFRLIRVHWK
jgi:hypothetical protein